mgnify:CR=1 FL=1
MDNEYYCIKCGSQLSCLENDIYECLICHAAFKFDYSYDPTIIYLIDDSTNKLTDEFSNDTDMANALNSLVSIFSDSFDCAEKPIDIADYETRVFMIGDITNYGCMYQSNDITQPVKCHHSSNSKEICNENHCPRLMHK